MERLDELAAIVIVKADVMRDIEKVTGRLKELLKYCHIQNLVFEPRRRYLLSDAIGAAGSGRLAGVLTVALRQPRSPQSSSQRHRS